MNLSEKNYNDFKCLLEYFVAHLELLAANLSIKDEKDFSILCNNANWDSQDPRRIRIQEALSSNNIGLAGQGYNNGPIQQQIQKWANFNGKRICISVQKGNPKGSERLFSRATYLQWEDAGYNIRCNWNSNKTKVDSIYIVDIEKKPEQVILTHQINDLNLFVEESSCTKKLVEFFNTYYDMIINRFTNEIKLQVESNSNLILTGAPGTGKTYLAKEIAKAMTGDNEAHYEMVQFHPSYDYSDFVEGLRPVKNANGNIGFERKDGVFKAFCKKALVDGYTMTEEGWKYKGEKAPKYVFIIDEINRGEMSKIFGELFFSIDPGYRGTDGRINTQYQNLVDKEYDGNGNEVGEDVFKEGFFVPKNVYIIGTMNDIDRSVESMDFAMRRRFAFKEVRATDRETMLDEKISDDTIRNEAINRMRNVNYRIQTIEGLNEAYHIGPAYFGKIEGDNFTELWNNHIKGLLYEYLRGIPNAKEFLDSLERAFKEKEPYVTINNNGDLEIDASKSEDWKNKIVNKQ